MSDGEEGNLKEFLKLVFLLVVLPLTPLLVADIYYTYCKKEWPR